MENTHAKGARWLLVIGIAAFIGLADSTYLTAYHYQAVPLLCTTSEHGCAAVLHSSYAMVGPVPLAAFGVAFYLAVLVFIIVIYHWRIFTPRMLCVLVGLTVIGFGMSVIFESMQLFLIHAFCEFCALSATVATLQFACSLQLVRNSSESPIVDNPLRKASNLS